MSSRGRDLLKLSGIVAIAFVAGLAFASALNLPRPGRAETTEGLHYVNAAAAPLKTVDGVLPSFADIAERVRPSVVYVTTQTRLSQNPHQNVPPEFRFFFGPNFQMPRRPQIERGSGSGFIVSQDGYILTNNHVVADADKVKVTLLDNRVFDARVVGRDPGTDIAVIKIDADHLTPIPLGNSDAARVGDWVLAIGNPLNFTFTVTAGIVSAKGRSDLAGLRTNNLYQIQDFIQTDAAINPGNSGGPLVNLQGQVIGINAAIASQTGYYEGYGFAVPINLARKVMDDLIATGHVQRAMLGVAIAPVTPVDARAVGLSQIDGVVIKSYSSDQSPAKVAGLELGDVIVALNDTAVDHVAQLQTMVGFRHPGDVVHVTVVRSAGKRQTFNVRLAAVPDSTTLASAGGGSGGTASSGNVVSSKLGFTVQGLSADDAAHVSSDMRGPVVTDVDEDGPAFGQVFGPSQNGNADVILKIDGQRVRTVASFEQAVRRLHKGQIASLIVATLGDSSRAPRIARIQVR
jgi:serine protease Do